MEFFAAEPDSDSEDVAAQALDLVASLHCAGKVSGDGALGASLSRGVCRRFAPQPGYLLLNRADRLPGLLCRCVYRLVSLGRRGVNRLLQPNGRSVGYVSGLAGRLALRRARNVCRLVDHELALPLKLGHFARSPSSTPLSIDI